MCFCGAGAANRETLVFFCLSGWKQEVWNEYACSCLAGSAACQASWRCKVDCAEGLFWKKNKETPHFTSAPGRFWWSLQSNVDDQSSVCIWTIFCTSIFFLLLSADLIKKCASSSGDVRTRPIHFSLSCRPRCEALKSSGSTSRSGSPQSLAPFNPKREQLHVNKTCWLVLLIHHISACSRDTLIASSCRLWIRPIGCSRFGVNAGNDDEILMWFPNQSWIRSKAWKHCSFNRNWYEARHTGCCF